MIRRVSLRVRSASLTVPAISELMEADPAASVEAGSPVSLRTPGGRRHRVTTWVHDSPLYEGCEFSDHLTALKPLLHTLDRARIDDVDLSADIVVMLQARDLGSWVGLNAEDLIDLAAARCGLQLDCYGPDPHAE